MDGAEVPLRSSLIAPMLLVVGFVGVCLVGVERARGGDSDSDTDLGHGWETDTDTDADWPTEGDSDSDTDWPTEGDSDDSDTDGGDTDDTDPIDTDPIDTDTGETDSDIVGETDTGGDQELSTAHAAGELGGCHCSSAASGRGAWLVVSGFLLLLVARRRK